MDHTVAKSTSRSRGRFFLTRGDAARLIVSALGFFIGRAVLFSNMDPIAVAFLASLIGTGYTFYTTAFFLLLGAATKLSGLYLIKYGIGVGLLCLVNLFVQQYLIRQRKLYFKNFAQALSGAICALVGGIAVSWLGKLNLYVVFIAMMESALVFGLVFVLKKAALVLTSVKKKSALCSEDLISLAILFGCVIVGASDIHIGVISLRFLLCFYFILTAAHMGDAAIGSAAGLLVGVLLYIAGFWQLSVAVMLALSGLAAGLFKPQGKIIVFIAFCLACAGAFYFFDSGLFTVQALCAALLAGVCFFVTPHNFNYMITAHLNPILGNAEEYLDKMKTMTAAKLNGFAESFEKLAHTFDGLSSKKIAFENSGVSAIIDDVAIAVCGQCPKRPFCWEENFYATYQYVYGILDQCEKKGWAEKEDAPEGFANTCVDTERFIHHLNRLFEVYKTNLNWKKDVAESRDLVGQQLESVAGIIKNLADEMGAAMLFKEDLEEKVLLALVGSKIEVDSVIVLENKAGRYEVSISHKFYYDKRRWNRTVINALNATLKKKMQIDEEEKGKRYVTKFIEEKKLRVACGVARLAKGRKGESGDSYSFMEVRNGECLLALSDGMGTGHKAQAESAATVELLENFLESGFDKKLALKIINSALALRNGEESFATLDICSVDLYTGDAEFIKIGAAATFLVRDGKVFVIRSTSLPIGMLKDVDMEISRRKLIPNDVLLMVTDGLLDISELYGDKEDWIANALRECRFINPQEIAEYILFEAQRLSEGFIQDDMTVLAARVLEK